MTNTDVADDAARLARLGLVLHLREAAIEPVIRAAAASKISELVVGASAHGQRLEIVMPYRPEALAAVAPGITPTGPLADRIRIRIDGDSTEVGVARSGAGQTPKGLIDELAPPAVRASWFDLVDQMCSIADARVTGVTRWLGSDRADLEVAYPARDRATEEMLVMGIDQLAGDLGLSAAQRKLWIRVHPQLGQKGPLAVTTGCGPTGVSKRFGMSYPITQWEVAMRLAEGLVLNDSEAREVPVLLGQLSGAVGADHLERVELVLGPHEPPDVIVWARIFA